MIDPLFQRILVRECRRRGIPIIFDEVLSGCWRFGSEVCKLSLFVPIQPLLNFFGHKMLSLWFFVELLPANINYNCRLGCQREINAMVEYFSFNLWSVCYCQSAADLLGCTPDIACYSKLLTGGLVPLSATLATRSVFGAFRGISKAILKSLGKLIFLLVQT